MTNIINIFTRESVSTEEPTARAVRDVIYEELRGHCTDEELVTKLARSVGNEARKEELPLQEFRGPPNCS